jgi:hypothetical protein
MRARTSDALRKELENDIAHGRLSPGDKLDEQTLATRFDVSRTPARPESCGWCRGRERWFPACRRNWRSEWWRC